MSQVEKDLLILLGDRHEIPACFMVGLSCSIASILCCVFKIVVCPMVFPWHCRFIVDLCVWMLPRCLRRLYNYLSIKLNWAWYIQNLTNLHLKMEIIFVHSIFRSTWAHLFFWTGFLRNTYSFRCSIMWTNRVSLFFLSCSVFLHLVFKKVLW